jgi:23S rRNA-/tRNA-specific pseudouridylate synthase
MRTYSSAGTMERNISRYLVTNLRAKSTNTLKSLLSQLMTVYDGPPGKPALTHVRTLAFDGKLSASLVRIETGRLDSFCHF